MNTEDLVRKEREEEIYRERNQARRDAGGAGPLSHYDFGVGFRAALNELKVVRILETPYHEQWFDTGGAGKTVDLREGAVLVRTVEARDGA